MAVTHWKSIAVLLAALQLTYANLPSESSVTSAKMVSTPTLGSLYRGARDDYSARYRCANCGSSPADREMRPYARPSGTISGYYSGMGSIYDDRNWYYRPEAQDDRYRNDPGYYRPQYMSYEQDRYMMRYDDRYNPMASRGYYDNRMPYYPEMMRGYGYRGNGYDNLDPQYDYYMTQRGGGGVGYNRDRYDDRMGYRPYYDHKNFRPWDETYRGISGFDNSGRGYYFASRPPTASSASSSTALASSHAYTSPTHTSHGTPVSYGGSNGGGYNDDRHSAIRPGGYPLHHNGPDRPDYDASSENCCANRYPPSVPSQPSSHSGSYYGAVSSNTGSGSGADSGGSSSANYGPNEPEKRPNAAGFGHAGSWGYVNVGSSGGPSATYGYGHKEPYGNAPAGPGSHGSAAPVHEYASRGEHHREPDRQQSAAYGGRPRPSALGATSYLMDRDNSNVAEPATSSSRDNDKGTTTETDSKQHLHDDGIQSDEQDHTAMKLSDSNQD